MNWFKENPFLAGILLVSLVGAGGLGYLIFDSFSAYTTSTDSYTAAVAKLHALQNKVPFPSDINLKSIKAGLEDYAARITSLRAQLAGMQVPLDDKVTPQQFQDGLRTAVNDLRIKAEANGVKLPENFYFGFDQYQTQVPTERAAPYLHRQFLVIQALVTRLVDFKVTSIDGIVRPPLPQESQSAATAPKKNDAEPVVVRFPFDVAFTAEQGKFRVAFNSLLGADQFLIVRSVGIQNTNALAPAKKGLAENASQAPNPFTASPGLPAKDQSSLQVILGRELLKANLRLEMLVFTPPEPAKK